MTNETSGILNEELYDQFCDELWGYDDEDEQLSAEFAEHWQVTQDLAVVLKRHFRKFETEAQSLDYVWLAERMLYYASTSLIDIMAVKQALADLRELKRCLLTAQKLMDGLPDGVNEIMRLQALSKLSHYFGKPAPKDVNMEDVVNQCPQYSSFRVVSAAMDLLPYFTPVLKQTIEQVLKQSTPIGRKAMEAWHVVDAAARVCDALVNTISVPKRMGPSGDFYRLLIDLFDFFGIEEDPVNVTRNWAKHVGR